MLGNIWIVPTLKMPCVLHKRTRGRQCLYYRCQDYTANAQEEMRDPSVCKTTPISLELRRSLGTLMRPAIACQPTMIHKFCLQHRYHDPKTIICAPKCIPMNVWRDRHVTLLGGCVTSRDCMTVQSATSWVVTRDPSRDMTHREGH